MPTLKVIVNEVGTDNTPYRIKHYLFYTLIKVTENVRMDLYGNYSK